MESPLLNPKYVIDEHGERVAVILTMSEFEAISELLEDLADKAVVEQRRSEPGIPHAEAMRLVNEDCALPD